MCTLHGKTLRTLTTEERALVEANMNLVRHTVYKMAHKGWVKPYQEEDALQDGMIGLIKAAMYYKPETGYAFSTLAAKCIEQCVLMTVQKDWRRNQKHPMISMDEPKRGLFDRDGMMPEETLASDEDVEAETLEGTAEVLMRKLERLNRETDVTILRMYIGGMKLPEIGKALGMSKQNVHQRMRRLAPLLSEVMGRE